MEFKERSKQSIEMTPEVINEVIRFIMFLEKEKIKVQVTNPLGADMITGYLYPIKQGDFSATTCTIYVNLYTEDNPKLNDEPWKLSMFGRNTDKMKTSKLTKIFEENILRLCITSIDSITSEASGLLFTVNVNNNVSLYNKISSFLSNIGLSNSSNIPDVDDNQTYQINDLKEIIGTDLEPQKISIRIKNKYIERDLREASMNTINKPYEEKGLSPEMLIKYLIAEHSPIRSIEMRITMHSILYYNSVHFVRHVHSQPYVSTNREDNTKRKERSIYDTCTHIMDCNLQNLIDMSRKRLCIGKVESNTYSFMLAIKQKLISMGGLYAAIGFVMVPNCVYRHGCAEFKSCYFYNNTGITGNIMERYKEYNGRILK